MPTASLLAVALRHLGKSALHVDRVQFGTHGQKQKQDCTGMVYKFTYVDLVEGHKNIRHKNEWKWLMVVDDSDGKQEFD